jgi:hypothetical protein
MVLVVDALLNHLCLFKAIEDVVEESCTLFQAHAYLVVPGSEVPLGEELGTMELVDHRDRESILYGERIQRPVVDTEAPRPIGLLDEENG